METFQSSKATPRAVRDPAFVSWSLTALAIVYLALLLIVPLAAVFAEALRGGWRLFLSTFSQPEAVHAIKLTILVTAISVPLNVLFGIAAGWAITKHDFPFKNILITLIDLPFSVSPVISGMVFVLVFGVHGWLGGLLDASGFKVIFALPGIVLATVFITCPFVAREIIPTMQAIGREEEQAAVTLGAGGFRIFWSITLPNIRWALLYGVLLCTARAMGEFGAVSVVSGHIRGLTNTVPLHVEILYNEYNFIAAFAMASLLAILSFFTLALKSILDWWMHRPDLKKKLNPPQYGLHQRSKNHSLT